MPEKDPLTYDILTWGWVLLLSVWGGVVNFMRKVRDGETKLFKITELIGEVATSGFVGVLTFLLCESTDTDRLVSAVLVGVSGHMGAKTIKLLEMLVENKIGKPE